MFKDENTSIKLKLKEMEKLVIGYNEEKQASVHKLNQVEQIVNELRKPNL